MRCRKAHPRATPVVVALTLALLCGIAVPAIAMPLNPHAGKKHDYKRQVEELEEQWRTAQLTNDAATMDRLLSDDYIGISMTGQVLTKVQQLERVRTHQLALTRIDLFDMKVKLVGAIAIVTSRAEVVGVNENQPVQGTFRYTRVYQRLPNGSWKITSFEATRVPRHGGNRSNSNPPDANGDRSEAVHPDQPQLNPR
jgi:ketosteroid isomerase-like protein